MKIETRRSDETGARRLKFWRAYVVAVVATAATLGLRLALDVPLGGRPTLVIFTLPIILSACLGGLSAGLLATLLSYLAASYFLLPPIYSLSVASGADRWQQFFVALAGVVISLVSEALHRARRRAVLIEAKRVEVASHLAAIVESSDDAIIGKDLSGLITSWNRGAEIIFGYTAEEMVGTSITRLIPADRQEEETRILAKIKGGGTVEHFETARKTKDGRLIDVSVTISSIRDAVGRVIGASKVVRDITERKQAEAAIAVRARQQVVAAEIGRLALRGGGLQRLFDRVVVLVAETLGVEFCKVLELLPDGSALKLVAGVGWKEGLVGQATVGVGRDSQAGYTLLTKDLVIVEDLGTETRFKGPPLLRDHDVVSGLSVVIGELEKPFGVLGTHTTRQRKFTADDAHFFLSVANVLAEAVQRKKAEDRLRRSEEKFKTLFGMAPVGICVLDRQHNVIDANPALEQITRLRKEELVNGTHRRRAVLNAEGTPMPAAELPTERAMIENRSIKDVELGIAMENGKIIWVQVSAAPLALPDASAVVITQDITERKRAAKELEAANRQLRFLSRRLYHVQEEERRHLARELHDEVGQALTAAKINLLAVIKESDGAKSKRICETAAILEKLLGQVRQISLDLRPSTLDDLGLVPALRSLLDQQGRRASIAVHLSAKNVPEKLDAEIQTTCFRIAQEAITNAVRHADATRIDVDLARENGSLRLQVRDNGRGFDADAVQSQATGLGLVGIKERAALVGARAEIISSPNNGTTVEVSLPLTLSPERENRESGR